MNLSWVILTTPRTFFWRVTGDEVPITEFSKILNKNFTKYLSNMYLLYGKLFESNISLDIKKKIVKMYPFWAFEIFQFFYFLKKSRTKKVQFVFYFVHSNVHILHDFSMVHGTVLNVHKSKNSSLKATIQLFHIFVLVF